MSARAGQSKRPLVAVAVCAAQQTTAPRYSPASATRMLGARKAPRGAFRRRPAEPGSMEARRISVISGDLLGGFAQRRLQGRSGHAGSARLGDESAQFDDEPLLLTGRRARNGP